LTWKFASSIFFGQLFCVFVGSGLIQYEIKAAELVKINSAAFFILSQGIKPGRPGSFSHVDNKAAQNGIAKSSDLASRSSSKT
jgi:hypothetical protein